MISLKYKLPAVPNAETNRAIFNKFSLRISTKTSIIKKMKRCKHFDQIKAVEPNTPNGCEECLESGDEWLHLRLCLICGHVGCCDDSKNTHATKHFKRTKHPLIKSFEPDEEWIWCYEDNALFE